jgi:uncharacterized protein (TIGR03067 family)
MTVRLRTGADGRTLSVERFTTEIPMRPICAIALVVGTLVLGGAATADESADKKALKELEGTYLLVSAEGKGAKFTEADLKKVPDADRKLVVKGDQIISYFGSKENPATVKLDASHTPAHIDLTTTKDGKTEVNYAIYKLENGVLTICALEKGDAKDRPKEFKASSKDIVMVLKKHDAK